MGTESRKLLVSEIVAGSPDLVGVRFIVDKANGVEIVSEGAAAVVAFRSPSISEVDVITAASKKLKAFIDENKPRKVIFDFEGVKFFSSQVLGLLLDIRAKTEPYNGEVVVSAINPQLHRVFKITNLDKVFKFFPDKQSAVEAVSTV
jgi:anti-sigma B factor antagonist